jgi:zinc transport system substrate-binding protein
MSRRRVLPVSLVAACALALTACGSAEGAAGTGSDGDGGLQVLVSFYPLQFVAERVGGDAVTVSNLTAPGAEPHDLELSPQQVAQVSDADVLLFEKGFQPAVDEAVEQNAAGAALDVTTVVPLEDTGSGGDDPGHGEDEAHADEAHADETGSEHAHTDEPHVEDEAHVEDGHEHAHDLEGDPHIWLDPTRLATITEHVADRFAEIDADGAEGYRARAAELTAELTALDRDFETGLRSCERNVFVTSHAAYGYLANRYGLDMVSISGLSPEIEPSPARVREVQGVIEREGVDTIFYERLVSPKVAETIAADLKVTTAVLDPIEGLTDETADEDYLSLMRQNLEALSTANGCR